MSRKTLSPEALALSYLRSERGWLQKELAARMGLSDYRQVSRHESGDTTLSRETLDSYAACLGTPPEAVDALLFLHSMIAPAPVEPASPVALTPEERRRIDRAALTAGWTTAADVRETATRRKRREKAEAARREAETSWARLKAYTRQERLDRVASSPELRSWALAVIVCEASVRAAAHRPEQALELAELALFIADRASGEGGWRNRLMGYAWAHVANAHRVANRLGEADAAFVQAWDLWRASTPTDPELLPEWRLLDLEASLRREERRFPLALELLERALAANGGDQAAMGRILLNKEFVLEQMGDSQGAIAVARAAAPYVEASGDPRLQFALLFKAANNAFHLERYAEAVGFLPKVRDLAERQADELSLLRVEWLEARIAAGQGRTEEAADGLKHVGRTFAELKLPYDAALASLDLAVLWLKAGLTTEVRELAVALEAIFKAHGIDREALAAVSLFCQAAREETATVELALRAIAEIEEARRSVPRGPAGRRGRR
jgi:tetratricopeptide (TPR) repeat protein